MHILVTGGNGQLGNEMRQVAQNSTDKYIFTDVVSPEGVETTLLDITDLEAVRALVKQEAVKVGKYGAVVCVFCHGYAPSFRASHL